MGGKIVEFTKVAGRKTADLTLYALSTCHWCHQTKEFLNNLEVEYQYLDVDRLTGSERAAAIAEVKKWNPALSFPVLVVNSTRAILGLREDEIRGAVEA